MIKSQKHYIFSMTQGKTGTTYLADLLGKNVKDCESHHEILNFNSFGVDTPDLSTLTLFNSEGNVSKVRNFWETKFAKIKKSPHQTYIETSHILMKAGLLENINSLTKNALVHLIILKRDPIKIFSSYINSFDFTNSGNMWMWYLDPRYPRNITEFKPFVHLGTNGVRLWYIYEIEARIEYYKKILKGVKNISFYEINIEKLNDKKEVKKFIRNLGLKPRSNQIALSNKFNKSRPLNTPKEDIEAAKALLDSLTPPAIVANKYIKSGRRLG